MATKAWEQGEEQHRKRDIGMKRALDWEIPLHVDVCVCVFKVVCLQFRAEIGSSLLDTAETAEAREVARRLAASVAPTTTNEPWKKAKMKSK